MARTKCGAIMLSMLDCTAVLQISGNAGSTEVAALRGSASASTRRACPGPRQSGAGRLTFAAHFLADDAPQPFFKVVPLHGLPQRLVDEGLIAPLARLRLELFDSLVGGC